MTDTSRQFSETIKEIREAAKYYASVAGILQGTYFTLTSIAGLKGKLSQEQALFLYAPIIFWMLTLIISLNTMDPLSRFTSYENWSNRISKFLVQKELFWKVARISFYVGLFWMVCASVWYLFILKIPSNPPIMIIVTPTP